MVGSSKRIFEKEIPYPLGNIPPQRFSQFAEDLQGTYGKRWKLLRNGNKMAYYLRTEVVHYKEQVVGTPHIMWNYPGWGSTCYTLDASYSRGAALLNAFEPVLSAVEYRLLNSIYNRLKPDKLSFNLFNFLYEAREIPSLADPFKASLKRLTTPQKAKSLKSQFGDKRWKRGVIDDIASTYVNGQFGFVPTISDSKEIMERFSSLKDSYSRVKELSKRKIRYGYTESVTLDNDPDFMRLCSPAVISNTDEGARVSLVFTKATCTVNGVASYEVPLLQSLAFTTSVLDRAGLHLDLATLWNAVPFSWLVDWVVPIGDALAADRQPWTEINILNDGTLSWKIEYMLSFKDDNVQKLSWSGRPPNYSSSGSVLGSIYWRYKIPAIKEYRYPPFRFGNWDLRKGAILAAVANGFRK